jgi:hypothetical protein
LVRWLNVNVQHILRIDVVSTVGIQRESLLNLKDFFILEPAAQAPQGEPDAIPVARPFDVMFWCQEAGDQVLPSSVSPS